MADGPERDGRAQRNGLGTSAVPVSRKLQMVAVLLGIVGVLGLVTATMVAISPEGDGLGAILPVDEADVMGQVRDVEGYLVPDARVSYPKGGISNTTGQTGWYFLEDVDTGEVELRMDLEGYKTVVKTVHLERGTYTVDFLAEPGTGTVELPGVAVPEAGDPGTLTWLMALGMVVASAFALLGSVSAYLQRWYPLVIIGCLLGIFTWGWFIGSAISVLALLIALPLRDQFGPKAIDSHLPWHEEPPPDLEIPKDTDDGSDGDGAVDVSTVPGGGRGPGGSGGMPPG